MDGIEDLRDGVDDADDAPVELSAYETSPDRLVFSEPNNSEAWISTDLTVLCKR